jgi:uncharacterized protein
VSPVRSLLLLSALAAVTVVADDPSSQFLGEWRVWHAQRISALKKPQGWLSLVGLHWLKAGPNRVAGLPGTFEVENGEVRLVASAADGYRVGGELVTTRRLATDASEAPDRLVLGDRAAMVIDRGHQLALRVWDADSPLRREFKGIEVYPPDPRWRIEARWEAYPQAKSVEVPSVVGLPQKELAPGRAWFRVDGQELSLEPTLDGDSLFFVFKDQTAPAETYGAGRFLTAAAPRDGKVILDFNRAYNPPCAFTPHATCPLPLPQNILKIRVEAGEKKWGAGH